MKKQLIAPCGMNCNICAAYLRTKKKCPGCRDDNENKSNSCINCIIKNCRILKNNELKYCSDKCDMYPCIRLKNLDKRYRTKYNMSMIENLTYIKKNGISKFINNEKKRWIKGNKILCIHNKKYYPYP
jgi:hypothetical protein